MSELQTLDWQTATVTLIVIAAALYLLGRWLPRGVARRLGLDRLGVKPAPVCGTCNGCAGCPAAHANPPPVKKAQTPDARRATASARRAP